MGFACWFRFVDPIQITWPKPTCYVPELYRAVRWLGAAEADQEARAVSSTMSSTKSEEERRVRKLVFTSLRFPYPRGHRSAVGIS